MVFGRQAAYEVAAVAVGRRAGHAVRGRADARRRARVARRRRRPTTRRRRVAARCDRAQAFRLNVGRGRHFVMVANAAIVIVVGACRVVVHRVLDLHTDHRTSALRQTEQVDVSFDVHCKTHTEVLLIIFTRTTNGDRRINGKE